MKNKIRDFKIQQKKLELQHRTRQMGHHNSQQLDFIIRLKAVRLGWKSWTRDAKSPKGLQCDFIFRQRLYRVMKGLEGNHRKGLELNWKAMVRLHHPSEFVPREVGLGWKS